MTPVRLLCTTTPPHTLPRSEQSQHIEIEMPGFHSPPYLAGWHLFFLGVHNYLSSHLTSFGDGHEEIGHGFRRLFLLIGATRIQPTIAILFLAHLVIKTLLFPSVRIVIVSFPWWSSQLDDTSGNNHSHNLLPYHIQIDLLCHILFNVESSNPDFRGYKQRAPHLPQETNGQRASLLKPICTGSH